MEEISGTDRHNWSRIEVAVSVHNRLGTKTAHTENENHVLERFHVTASTWRGPNVVMVPARRRQP
jgi:hypothetical protein